MKKRQLEIIEAAGRILNMSGVKGLTIKNLAKEMQFSESAIYRHFHSKEDIIVAMLNYLAERMDDLFAKVVRPKDPPDEKLKGLLRTRFVFFKEHPHFVVAVFTDGLMEESGRINEAIFMIMNVMKKHLLPIIKEGQAKRVFTNAISAEDMIHIIMGTFRLQKLKWRIANFEFDLKKDGEKKLQSILALIKEK
ncbi:MAG: TetR/AcrR family transcriptional regulator [Saprospiraceae bacterium]|nr:TetR/AcrR family transcriptional regulator [Saprospiraceae bacterium]